MVDPVHKKLSCDGCGEEEPDYYPVWETTIGNVTVVHDGSSPLRITVRRVPSPRAETAYVNKKQEHADAEDHSNATAKKKLKLDQ